MKLLRHFWFREFFSTIFEFCDILISRFSLNTICEILIWRSYLEKFLFCGSVEDEIFCKHEFPIFQEFWENMKPESKLKYIFGALLKTTNWVCVYNFFMVFSVWVIRGFQVRFSFSWHLNFAFWSRNFVLRHFTDLKRETTKVSCRENFLS